MDSRKMRRTLYAMIAMFVVLMVKLKSMIN